MSAYCTCPINTSRSFSLFPQNDLDFETPPVAQHRLPLLDSSPISPRVTSFMEDLSLWLRSPLSPHMTQVIVFGDVITHTIIPIVGELLSA